MHARFADINHRTHWEGFEELESAPVLVVVVQEELELIAVMVLVQSWVLPELVLGHQIAFSFEEMKPVVGCSVHAVVI